MTVMEAISALGYTLLGGAVVGGAFYTIGADLLAAHGRGRVRCGPQDQQAVALTFDDGPDLVFTPCILATLAQFGASHVFRHRQAGRAASRDHPLTEARLSLSHAE